VNYIYKTVKFINFYGAMLNITRTETISNDFIVIIEIVKQLILSN